MRLGHVLEALTSSAVPSEYLMVYHCTSGSYAVIVPVK